MRVARKLLPLLALAWLLFTATAVQAHAILLFTDPADGSVLPALPVQVRLLFSESVQPIAGGIIVVSPTGRRVGQGSVEVHGASLSLRLHGQETGSYLVIWQVISADTHPSRGQFVFSVRHKTATADAAAGSSLGLALQVTAHWLHFLGFALTFGGLVFRLAVIEAAAPLPETNRRRFTRLVVRRLRPQLGVDQRLGRVMLVGVVLMLLAEGAAIVAQTASLGASSLFDPGLAADVLASSFGRVLAQRIAAALLFWALLSNLREPGVGVGCLGVGIALALVDGQAAHAASAHPQWLGYGLDAIHVLAMAAWLGGLAVLIAVWDLPEIRVRRREVVRAFGRVAAAASVFLAVSGIGLAIEHLGGLDHLGALRYGQALTAKSLLFLTVLVVALARRQSPTWSSKWWRVEVGLVLLMIGLAGVMISVPPGL